jgi:hypothetical protein
MVGPVGLFAAASEFTAAPLPAQPPSAQATASKRADIAAFRRHRLFDAFPMTGPIDIVKID